VVLSAVRWIDDECIGVFTSKLESVMADCQPRERRDPPCDSSTGRVKQASEPTADEASCG